MPIVAPFAAAGGDAFGVLLAAGAADALAGGFALAAADADGDGEAAGLVAEAAVEAAGAGASAASESEEELHAALPRQTATTVAIADLRRVVMPAIRNSCVRGSRSPTGTAQKRIRANC
jgi:hypothetical protein